MRKHGRVDTTQQPIVDALRAVGCFVQLLSAVGGGCPDALVWSPYLQRWVAMEIKSPRGTLTPDQVKWIYDAGAPVAVVCSPDEALAAVGVAVARVDR
jgi:hypothetical protein